ncbi:MAG: HD-GYP domain-containing protein [Chloroflexi bacterium]|nr:HD-GYP domain-containing protein [Chloroflexota bacterium]
MTTKPFSKLGDDYENVAHFMIKNQPVGFLWADSSLHIQYISSELQEFLPDRNIKRGEHLSVQFPETVGLESHLQEILAWQREPISLENINLISENGEIHYISLILYAGKQDEKMGIFLVVKDTTKSGEIIQELNQSRNELRLLKRELELTNTALSKTNQVQGMSIVSAAQEVSRLYRRSQEEIAERKELEKELKKAYNETLKGWSLALNLRDVNTDKHSQRVIEMTLYLTEKIGIPKDQMNYVRWGAILHDIGKMGIPDKILLKPAPLTDEEWKIMELHPGFAYDMLSGIPFLKPAVDIPYNHHENWDGSGYPRGLKGEEIPLTARAFSIIDTFDALTSDRVYRSAWSKEDALTYIKSKSGTKFDPDIVPIFLEIITKS